MQLPILGEKQPCLQAAAFRAKAPASQAVIAVLNICNTTIPVTLLDRASGGSAIVYDLMDPGGKSRLPSRPDVFPWPEPLHANTVAIATSGVYTALPLTFAIVELAHARPQA